MPAHPTLSTNVPPDHAPDPALRATPITPSSVYRLESVATRKQRAVFVGMQLTFLATLLAVSVQLITTFLSPLISSTKIVAILIVYCTFAAFWQITYIVRILAMKRAVLLDRRAPTGLRIAMATTIVPSRELALLHGKLEGMARVDPCGNTIDHWVLDEEDDPRVKAMIETFNRRYRRRGVRIFHFTRKRIVRYNEAPKGRSFSRFQHRQKGGNINAWLDATSQSGYDIITFLDLDHVPKPGFYRTVLPYFRDRHVGFVQGPESFRNRNENFITRAASLERDTFFGLIHRSYFGLDMPVIVGSHTTFRADTLRALGGYYPVHLTEDYLIMLELRARRQRGIFVDEVLAVGELPSTWTAYLGQQQRWASGGLDLLLRYFPTLFSRYSTKEKLFYFALLNYYAWGTFFVLSKIFLYVFLLTGLALRLEAGLIVGILAFTVVAAIANHLWERQFFIESEEQSFLLENIVMNNFVGGLYCLSLLHAVLAPNTPFAVTAKSGSGKGSGGRGAPYLAVSWALVTLEIAALATVWISQPATPTAAFSPLGHNLLVYPLLLSIAGILMVLVGMRRMERATTKAVPPRLRLVSSDAHPATRPLANVGS